MFAFEIALDAEIEQYEDVQERFCSVPLDGTLGAVSGKVIALFEREAGDFPRAVAQAVNELATVGLGVRAIERRTAPAA